MEIRLANNHDIPGLIHLLKQVGEVHHQIRPDLFRPGAVKYTEAELKQLLRDKSSRCSEEPAQLESCSPARSN